MRVRVRVPCSTSNLGSGFDCLGLALDRYLYATYEAAAHPLRLERTGTLASLGVEPQDDIVHRVFSAALQRAGSAATGTITVDSSIPIGRGLGSSAAAIVATLALAARVLKQSFDKATSLEAAAALEGHPDNAAPALYGGLVAVTGERVVKLDVAANIRFVYAAPHTMVATAIARRTLPQSVSHAAATRTIARVVALVTGLQRGDPELLRIGLEDELHVPYRLPLIAGGAHAIAAAREAGAWAATISGSGSGLLALCEAGSEAAVLRAMKDTFAHATAADAIGFSTQPDHAGACYED